MFVERNQGIYQSSFVVLMLHIVYSIVAVLQVWYCVNLLIAKLFIHKPRLWNRDHIINRKQTQPKKHNYRHA